MSTYKQSVFGKIPNTWDVRGQTMWDQMGEYPWAASNQPSLQSKGVNFMAGTKKGKDFNPEDDLHPAGFTTNMGKLNWKTGDPHTGIASKLAIPIDEIIVICFNFLFGLPLASCGNTYLYTIPGKICKIDKN